MPTQPESVRDKVRAGYAAIAKTGVWLGANAGVAVPPPATGGCCSGGSAGGSGGGCCGPTTMATGDLARSIGYSDAELAVAPEGANMGLSCGNPTAIAALRPGETVLDLGAGGGFDCFIAGPKVGPGGRIIGVDMTAEMIGKARAGIEAYQRHTGLSNVEFRLGEIEHIPVADSSIDVVLSNCVLNLSPDKPQVWREIARVLRPGGRVAISDLALLQPLPAALREMVEALIGCVAGAALVSETEAMIRASGLVQVVLTPKPEYIRAMTNWEDPLYRRIVDALPTGSTASDFITSLDISAPQGRMNRLFAEAIGTFALVFAGTGAIVIDVATSGGVSHVGVALTFGLIVMAMIYAVGDTSGAHLNPAVTIGFVLARRFEPRRAPAYIAAQLVGAFAASGALRLLFPLSPTLGETLPSGSPWQSFALEAILTFLLMLVILRVSTGPKEKGITAAIAVGGVIALEALFAGPICGASMNPARSLAPAILSGHVTALWVYLIAPPLGASIAVACERWLLSEKPAA